MDSSINYQISLKIWYYITYTFVCSRYSVSLHGIFLLHRQKNSKLMMVSVIMRYCHHSSCLQQVRQPASYTNLSCILQVPVIRHSLLQYKCTLLLNTYFSVQLIHRSIEQLAHHVGTIVVNVQLLSLVAESQLLHWSVSLCCDNSNVIIQSVQYV